MTEDLLVIHPVIRKAMKNHVVKKTGRAPENMGVLTVLLAILTVGFILYNVMNVFL